MLFLLAALAAAWVVRRPARAITMVPDHGKNPLLTRVFGTGDRASIVISDASLVLLQEFLHRAVSLEEYLRSDYPRGIDRQRLDPGTQRILLRQAARPSANYSDIDAAHRLVGLSQQYQAKAAIRHPRHLHIRDFQTGSFVLLGGPLADPWYRLFESRLNFVFESDLKAGTAWIRNKRPLGAEQTAYSPDDAVGTEFAVISLMPNLRGTGSVLLLAGTAMEGTEAAGEMVIRENLPVSLREIVERARNPESSLEVLLETHVVAGIPADSKVVAWRVHASGEQP
jgi:hypothetical protein